MSERDYQKDLEICERASNANWGVEGSCIELALHKIAPHYIIRCIELDSKISFQCQHVNAVRQKYNLSPDIGFEDLAKLFANANAEGAVMRKALESISSIEYKALHYWVEDAKCMHDIAVKALKKGRLENEQMSY